MNEPMTADDALGPLPPSPLRDRIKSMIEMMVMESIQTEREACAKIADAEATDSWGHSARQSAAEAIAAAIRTRGAKER